jgi:hypothetical protein
LRRKVAGRVCGGRDFVRARRLVSSAAEVTCRLRRDVAEHY